MDKFFDRFKPKPKQDKKKNEGGGGLNFNFSLPGQKKFHGEGQSLGGSKPGKVISIQLDEPGPLGVKVEKRPNSMGTAIVAMVVAGSQAEKAGLERGDILCFQGSDGEEEITYDMFLELARSDQRPLCFEIRRIQTKSAVPPQEGKGRESAENYARKQAVIAAAEKREKEAKAWNKKTNPTKKEPPTTLLSAEERRKIEEERLARMDAAIHNQSDAAREAVEAAKRNEAQTAAQLGYNPYETNKVTSGQARNATVAQTHGTIAKTDSKGGGSSAPLPAVRPPSDPASAVSFDSEKFRVNQEFQVAYETCVTANDHAAVVTSFGIMRKLIVNATTKGQGDDETQACKFRKVRLGNAKIKEAIVDIEGAFDLMMAVGFQLTEDEGESFLLYPKGFPGENWLPRALSNMEKYEKL